MNQKRLFEHKFPRILSFPLTAACNYRCSFCELNGTDRIIKVRGDKFHDNVLSLNFIKQFELYIQKTARIDFGGLTGVGEPFMAPNFKSIVAYIRKKIKKLY